MIYKQKLFFGTNLIKKFAKFFFKQSVNTSPEGRSFLIKITNSQEICGEIDYPCHKKNFIGKTMMNYRIYTASFFIIYKFFFLW